MNIDAIDRVIEANEAAAAAASAPLAYAARSEDPIFHPPGGRTSAPHPAWGFRDDDFTPAADK